MELALNMRAPLDGTLKAFNWPPIWKFQLLQAASPDPIAVSHRIRTLEDVSA